MLNFFLENWFLITVITFLYFLPTFISLFNPKSKSFGIFIVNFVLGWTVLMWISLLMEAFQDPTVSRYNNFENETDEYQIQKKSSVDLIANDFTKFMSTKSLEKWVRNLK